jgi:hypothetical protein
MFIDSADDKSRPQPQRLTGQMIYLSKKLLPGFESAIGSAHSSFARKPILDHALGGLRQAHRHVASLALPKRNRTFTATL